MIEQAIFSDFTLKKALAKQKKALEDREEKTS